MTHPQKLTLAAGLLVTLPILLWFFPKTILALVALAIIALLVFDHCNPRFPDR